MNPFKRTINNGFGDSKLSLPRTSLPSAFFNGLKFIGTYTGGPTYVANNEGVLGSPGANHPACEGFRLDGTTYVSTDSSGNQIVASTPQKTVTYSADWTARTFAETFDKFDISDPLKAPGWLCEPVRTNLLTESEFRNGLTDATTKGGLISTTTFSGFTSGTGIAIGYDGVTSSYVYKNYSTIAGTTYTFSVFVRMTDVGAPSITSASGGSVLNDFAVIIEGTPSIPIIENMGGGLYRLSITKLSAASGVTFGVVKYPTNTSRTFKISGYQLEVGEFSSSYIPTTTAPMVRAATIASFPTAGKIPVNNFAIRMIVVPRASGQANRLFNTQTGADFLAIIITPTYFSIRKYNISPVEAPAFLAHSVGVPYEIIATSSANHGLACSVRPFIVSWGSFTSSTVNSTSEAKANAVIGTVYHLGAIQGASQFTGNISLFDCVPIPSGITDPMAWAKTHWGVA